MAKKKAISKKRVITDTFIAEGFLRPENLAGLCIDTEEDGLKDISNDLKELGGQFIKINISVKVEEDLTDIGFTKDDETVEED